MGRIRLNSLLLRERAMSSITTNAKKRCEKCFEYVKIHITCFKCGAPYHIYCWKKVPEAYVNQRGQLFCCGGLTSNYTGTDPNLRTQDNLPERVMAKGNLDGYNGGLESCLIKEENSEWNELKCEDACLLRFTNKEHLEHYYGECPNKEGELIQGLKEDKDLENCLHKEEDLEWSEFRCGTCLFEFANKEQLENHCSKCPNKEGETVQELNGDKAGLICSSHKEENFQKESYERHIKQSYVESSYSQLNNDNDTCVTDMKRNLAQGDDKKKTYKCTHCKYSAYSEADLVGHKNIHTKERPFKCDMCDCALASETDLTRHVLLKHSDAKKMYKCEDCEYFCFTECDLLKHSRAHTIERPFRCSICEYATARKHTLNMHIKVKHSNAEKEYKCGNCEYSTYRKQNLVKHTHSHANKKPFKCDICDYGVASSFTLTRHILVKHSNVEKMYKCGNCQYSSYSKTNLLNHKHIHTNEKPFKCDMCDYAAAVKGTLKTHVLMKHSNAEKTYKCGDCGYSSYLKYKVVGHKRIHTNEKPFKCDACDYVTAHKSNLNRHILIKHSNAEECTSAGIANLPSTKKGVS